MSETERCDNRITYTTSAGEVLSHARCELERGHIGVHTAATWSWGRFGGVDGRTR